MAKNEAYWEAERKVEEARRSGAKKLDLSVEPRKDSPKLAELPRSLEQLTQLRSLDVTNNELTALPEWLDKFTQLETLKFARNRLTALPAWLGGLTQLEFLTLA